MVVGAIAITAMFLVSGFSGMAGNYGTTQVDLIAGQFTDVGTVTVVDHGTEIWVTFKVEEPGWYLTETHLDIQTNPASFPLTKTNNPKVGQFAHSDTYELGDMVTEVTYKIADSFGDNDIYVAAHAVVVKATIHEAPYYAGSVYDYSQGLKKDGSAVDAQRSDPDQALELELGQSASNFFSLGFGGWIIFEYNCPVVNGEGDDVKIWEDTWGTYPDETAEVYASQDGTTWVYLGEADNTNRDLLGIHTVASFDLGSLAWAKYIKVVDTTDPSVHNNAADGYDLNAVEVLQDCVHVDQMETAWGFTDSNGEGFGGNSWAKYFEVASS